MSLFDTLERWLAAGPKIPATPPLQPAGTVLAIDDDATLLRAIRVMLGTAGFNVFTANRGAKGLEILRWATDPVRVVLLDDQMPELDGVQTLPYVRRLAPQARVVGLSGAAAVELPAAFRGGVDKLLRKPFTDTDLIALVAPLMDCDRGQTVPVRRNLAQGSRGQPVCSGTA